MKKVLFFDIDGTLVGFDGKIPDSTMEALREAQKSGHELAICTGRSMGQIYPFLFESGFDAVVAAAGAQVLYKGELIECHNFGEDRISKLLSMLEDAQVTYMIAEPERSTVPAYRLKSLIGVMRSRFQEEGDDAVLAEIEEALGTMELDERPMEHVKQYSTAESVIYFDASETLDVMREKVAPLGLQITASSFREVDDFSGEITLKGVSKATGMEALLTHLGLTREDCIAFGDGPNDVEMMKYAGISVAMGNAVDMTKEVADLVTDPIDQDGIANAMKKLGLIAG